jgi:hypothetical protein
VSRRVFVHVGSPGAGTAFLRRKLWANATSLEKAGTLLPGHERRQASAARARVRLTADDAAALLDPARAFPRLIREANAWDGDIVIAQEAFAAASPEQARSVRQALGDFEVHVVLTFGPLSMALIDAWQEQLAMGIAAPLPTFASAVRDHQRRGVAFWRVQDVPQVARRWAKDLPPAQVHLLPYSATWHLERELWARYCAILGLDPMQHDEPPAPHPPALGAVESALLLDVHAARDPRFTDKERHPWTRQLLVADILAHRPGPVPLAEPADAAQWLMEETAMMARRLEADSYQLHDELAQVAWHPSPPEARTIESVTPKELGRASRWVISRLQEMWVERMPRSIPPEVGADDGVPGILELLEYLRAYDTGTTPRPATPARTSTTERLRRSIAARRTS